MASRRHQRRNQCAKKIAHATEHDALMNARRLTRLGKHLRVYKCPWGDHWHLGHVESYFIRRGKP